MTEQERRDALEGICGRIEAQLPSVPTVTVEELDRLAEIGPITLADVRTDAERSVSIIPGAVPGDAVLADPVTFRNQPIVAYCTVGGRSARWVMEAKRLGLDAWNLRGSILAWTHDGRDLEHAGQPTRRVHVGGPRWSLAADGYEPVW